MDKDLIKKLKNDPYFNQFQEFMALKMDELNFISDLKNKSNLKAGETVRARAMAFDILYKMLEPFIDFKEKSEPSKADVVAARAKAGLS